MRQGGVGHPRYASGIWVALALVVLAAIWTALAMLVAFLVD
ncbi:MAG TPA: hypothetical protein VLJ44_08610 [Gaiellaceae bacterium]|nr:hypothetical protein [Gaiellaceae bacterium]